MWFNPPLILENMHKTSYSVKESRFISDNYRQLSDGEIARYLSRSENSVSMHRTRCLGLNRDRTCPNRTVKEDDLVRQMKRLIFIAERTQSPYILERCKQKLRKLSGIKSY